MTLRGDARIAQAAYLENLHAKRLKPGQQPVQGGLIRQRAVQDRFDLLLGGGKPLEI